MNNSTPDSHVPTPPAPLPAWEIVKLFLRTGPYMKPVGWHIAGNLTFLSGLFAFVLTFTRWNFGAFQTARQNNNELIGKFSFLFVAWFRGLDIAMGLGRAYYLLDLKPEVEDREDA